MRKAKRIYWSTVCVPHYLTQEEYFPDDKKYTVIYVLTLANIILADFSAKIQIKQVAIFSTIFSII